MREVLTRGEVDAIRDTLANLAESHEELRRRCISLGTDTFKLRDECANADELSRVLEHVRDVCLTHDATADKPILTDAEYHRIRQALKGGK